MKTRGTQLLTIVATLLIMMTALASTAGAQTAAGKGYGSLNPDGTVTENGINPAFGFPDVYRDANGLELALCLDGAPYCLAETTDGGPAHINTGPDDPIATNFPDEAFWWSGGASIAVPGGGSAQLTLAMEAAFANDNAVNGDQMSFGRIRLRARDVVPGADYTFVHPYGRATFTADDEGSIFETEDVGCFPSIPANRTCDFNDATFSRVATAFLVWDETEGGPAPAGYVGDPNVGHAVKGSPTGNNFFRFSGESPDTGEDMQLTTTEFFIEGKLASTAPVKCGDPGAPTDPDVCPVGPGGPGAPPAPVDRTAPTVANFSPTGNTVGRGANVVIVFSEPVTGVTGNSVQLQAGGRKVAATVTLSADGTRATLNPRQQMAADTRYRVVLSNRIADGAGNALTVRSWAFKTR